MSQIKAGAKKSLVPAYKDVDPYDLPDEFSNLQAQDMSKLGFMQDLIRGIKKLTEVEDKATQVVKETTIINSAVNTDSDKMVKRAMLALEDGDFDKADDFAEKALDLDPENANAYLVKLLVECKVQKLEDLATLLNPFDENSNFKKFIRFADKNLKDKMNGYVEERRKHSIYQEALRYIRDTSVDSNKRAIKLFQSIVAYKDSKAKISQCELNLKLIPYSEACRLMNSNDVDANSRAIKIFESIIDYSDSKLKIEQCKKNIEDINAKIELERKRKETQNRIFIIGGIVAVILIAIVSNYIDEPIKSYLVAVDIIILIAIFFIYLNDRQEKARIEYEARLPAIISALSLSIIANMVKCSAGSFVMGSPSNELGRESDEKQYNVTISKPFYIGKYEVTQKEYEAVMGKNPSNFRGENNPVECVSWNDAMEFCNKLDKYAKNIPQGYKFDLPTEAQWEYACRAETTTSLNSGKNITSETEACPNVDEVAWYDKNSYYVTHPVGQKKPNAWGIYDMHGNVWEWCKDWYGDYPSSSVTDPTGATSGSCRVFRGGSCYSYARNCRSAARISNDPDYGGGCLGFRIALVPVD